MVSILFRRIKPYAKMLSRPAAAVPAPFIIWQEEQDSRYVNYLPDFHHDADGADLGNRSSGS
jgi:hypothetical protein